MWQFEGTKDRQLVTSDWLPANQAVIEGVRLRQMSNVLSDNGRLTELWRRDWQLDGEPVDQVFQKVMAPGDLSAWHAHRRTTDRLFCGYGHVKLALYDARTASATRGRLMELRMGADRPALVVIPPGVWHGVQA
ncbi:MAG: dTDP-4-dehydrorhamnose 3,5-epimerase, partial [Aquabacterium sp.]